ncbi:MAG TPA: MBL fold metallo-hydrolase [Myxococcales bacterium]|nr:MBL fold metallo-hydrolase [Myxococcales bacterium]
MRLTMAMVLLLASCAHSPPEPRVTRDRELESLEQAVRWPNPSVPVVMQLANAYLAANRDSDGYAFFVALPQTQPLFEALTGLFQARSASTVALLSRVAWVEQAIARLDDAAAKDGLARYLRGVVFVALPDRFGKHAQGASDLQWVLENAARFPPGLARTARAALEGKSVLAADGSVSAKDGYRFTPKEIREPAKGVYVARGYDFADIGFVATSSCLVAIDAGTTKATAAEALAAVRKRIDLPLCKVIITHAHWDHVGGLSAFAGPGVEVIAHANFKDELAKVNAADVPFHYFFGSGAAKTYSLSPQRLVADRQTLTVGGTRFELIPTAGGETDDALMVRLPDAGVIFVGDAFMPYFGAPFVAEGSVEGMLETVAQLRALGPAQLIHGHPPLTDNFTFAVLEPLAAAVTELREATLKSLHDGRTLADALGDNLMPLVLRDHPDAVLPYLLMRDDAVQRLYAQRSGYWSSKGDGLAVFSDADWGAALDLLGGEAGVQRAAAALNVRGDHAMALRLATAGLAAHRDSPALTAERKRALDGLRARNQFNPFKLIVYSELAGEELQ